MPSLSLILLTLTAASAPAPPGQANPPVDRGLAQASAEDLSAEDPGPEGPAAMRPIVHLVADDALAPWLRERLFEDGYPLSGSPAAAGVQLTVVQSAEGGWNVTAKGLTTIAFVVEAATDFAVVRLEVLHRSIDALEDVAPAVPSEQPARVGVTVSDASSGWLPSEVAAGVLAAGATLVPADVPAQLRVCAAAGPQDGPRVSVVPGENACTEPGGPGAAGRAAVPPGETLSSTARMVATAMELLAASTPQARPVASDDALDERAEFVAGARTEEDFERAPGLNADPEGSRSRPRFVVRGGAAAGAIVRSSAVDALVAAWMTVGREPGIQGWAEMQVRPVTVVGDFLVVEVVPAIGFKVRPLSVRRFSLEAGALLGAEVHSYRVRGRRTSEQGTHIAASGEAAVGFAVAVWDNNEVHVALRFGGGSQRIHRFDGEQIWLRGGGRVGATVGFSFGSGPNS